MNIPGNLHYTNDHEWIKLDGNNGIVGITDYAQGELGDIVFIEIETIGEHLEKGQAFGTIEAVKTVSDLYMPVSGKVVDLNPTINDSPDLVNKDPYGKGWLIQIEVDNPKQVNELLDAAAYEKLINA
jgi:glycine cleavage system H protein